LKVSAPAKIILLGEHAAVFGNPVISATIDLRTYVDVKQTEKFFYINGEKFTNFEEIRKKYLLIGECIEKTYRYIEEKKENSKQKNGTAKKGLYIKIYSEIPMKKGLGSSASLASAMVMAISYELNCKLTLEEIANLSWEIENVVHKKSSGVDPFTVTYGGIIKYIHGKAEKIEIEKEDIENFNIAIFDTGISQNTGTVVEDVLKLRENFPEIFDEWLKTMKILIDQGCNCLKDKNYEKFAELMNVNHGLLYAIGVSSYELEKAVFELRKYYNGAKLSGKGRGGIAIGFKRKDDIKDDKVIKDNIKNLNLINAKICKDGVRIENKKF